jgi:RNA polymerase subunit RPABC4/transcription elongation factor Spt4
MSIQSKNKWFTFILILESESIIIANQLDDLRNWSIGETELPGQLTA